MIELLDRALRRTLSVRYSPDALAMSIVPQIEGQSSPPVAQASACGFWTASDETPQAEACATKIRTARRPQIPRNIGSCE